MDHPPTLVTQERGSPDGILHDMQAGTGGFHPTLALAQRLPWVELGRNDAEARGLNTLLRPLPGP